MDKHIETLGMMEATYAHIRKNDDQYEAIEAAISALQEQAERKKGCDFCNPEVMDGNPIFSRHADGYLGSGKFCTDAGVGVKAYFCPKCGRRLK